MNNMEKFLEGLEKKTKSQVLNEDAYDVIQSGGKSDWYYVPKQDFLNGILRVAVHEVSDDKWEIIYCAPEAKSSKAAKKGAKGLMAGKEIENYRNLLKEEVEGDANAIKSWTVKTKWSGGFQECLEKCIDLVEGKTSSLPSGFKAK